MLQSSIAPPSRSWLVEIARRYSSKARTGRAELLSKRITLKHDDRALDLGGGTGDHFHSIFPNHKKVVIADVLERELVVARERYGYATVRLPDDSTKLPFKDGEFDFVFCS